MSLFNWLSTGRKSKPEASPSVMPSSGMSRLDSTKPFATAHHHGSAQPANRKHERMVRREQLYGVVREAMVRASVLSSSYKFKVLSLDPSGRTFLVMMDLVQGAASDTGRLAEIEAMIAQSAKARHDILVTAVYWRANDYVAVGEPLQQNSGRMPLIAQPAAAHAEPNVHRAARQGASSRPAPLVSQPAPLASQTAPLASRPAPLAPQPARPIEARSDKVDPLQADEVAAFRKALDAGLRGEQALAAVGAGKPPQNYTLLTGFEDTEMADEGAAGELSGTQYGALR